MLWITYFILLHWFVLNVGEGVRLSMCYFCCQHSNFYNMQSKYYSVLKTVKLSLKKLLIQDNFHTKLMIGLYQKLILMHNDVRCMLIICDQLKVWKINHFLCVLLIAGDRRGGSHKVATRTNRWASTIWHH